MAACCVCVLTGLPGAGKTSIAKALLEFSTLDRNAGVVHICFDKFVELQIIGEQCDGTKRRLIIVDDNMHLSSMRHEVYSLARNHRAAFVILYLDIPTALALERNAKRCQADRVPEHVITKMAKDMEPPDPAARPWEQNLIRWHVQKEDQGTHPAQLGEDAWKAIMEKWGDPPPPLANPEDLTAQREKGTAANRASVCHAVDLRARQFLNRVAAELAHNSSARGGSGNEDELGRKEILRSLSMCKKDLLVTLRRRLGERSNPKQGGPNAKERVCGSDHWRKQLVERLFRAPDGSSLLACMQECRVPRLGDEPCCVEELVAFEELVFVERCLDLSHIKQRTRAQAE